MENSTQVAHSVDVIATTVCCCIRSEKDHTGRLGIDMSPSLELYLKAATIWVENSFQCKTVLVSASCEGTRLRFQ